MNCCIKFHSVSFLSALFSWTREPGKRFKAIFLQITIFFLENTMLIQSTRKFDILSKGAWRTKIFFLCITSNTGYSARTSWRWRVANRSKSVKLEHLIGGSPGAGQSAVRACWSCVFVPTIFCKGSDMHCKYRSNPKRRRYNYHGIIYRDSRRPHVDYTG